MLCKRQTRFSSVHRHHPPSLLLKVARIWPPQLQSVNNVSRTMVGAFQYLFWCCSPLDSFQSGMVLVFLGFITRPSVLSDVLSLSFIPRPNGSLWSARDWRENFMILCESLIPTFQPVSKRLAQSPKPASTSPYWTSLLHSQRNVPASPSSVLPF